jgi:hypothetical protein
MTRPSHLPLPYVSTARLGRIYWRELPGGGFVALDVAEHPAHPGGRYLGTITVERRSDAARRVGCAPPVVAEWRGWSPGLVLYHLLPIARSNPAIGHALLRRGMVSID